MKFEGLRFFFCKLLYVGFYIRRNNGIIMWPSGIKASVAGNTEERNI